MNGLGGRGLRGAAVAGGGGVAGFSEPHSVGTRQSEREGGRVRLVDAVATTTTTFPVN
jgi:hypothetical protein